MHAPHDVTSEWKFLWIKFFGITILKVKQLKKCTSKTETTFGLWMCICLSAFLPAKMGTIDKRKESSTGRRMK